MFVVFVAGFSSCTLDGLCAEQKHDKKVLSSEVS
jgi:hypothetical protein